MTKVVDYKMIFGFRDFEKKVRKAIDEGWQPLGAPFFDAEHCLFIQAMVKEE